MASALGADTVGYVRRLFSGGAVAGMSDAQLLGRFLAVRDEAAFEALVSRHGPMVHGVCRAVLRDPARAEDAFQATFLVLARRGGAIRGRSVGGWLHRVAHRVAARAGWEDVRRRARERRAGELRTMLADDDRRREDLRAAIHEEVRRLPERHRLAVVLCDLEGRTRPEAAAELGWSEATLGRRLAEAREKLRSRLVRSGLAPSAVAVAGAVVSEAEAAVPAACVARTIRAATGGAAPGAATTTAVMLADGVIRDMVLTKITVGAVALLAAVSAAGVAALGLGVGDSTPAEPPRQVAEKRASAAVETPPKPPKADDIAIEGRVLDPDGRPHAGAKLTMLPVAPGGTFEPRATTDAEGKFRVVIPAAEIAKLGDVAYHVGGGTIGGKASELGGALVATAEGFGPAWSMCAFENAKDKTLRLVRDDVPIRGRVLDLQGRPVAGVTVRPVALKAPEAGDLSAFLAALPDAVDAYNNAENERLHDWLPESSRFFAPTVTDAEGRFRFAGAGRERVLAVFLEGAGIATTQVGILTRPGATISRPAHRGFPDLGTATYHGAEFDHVVAPGREVAGVVRDKTTKRPIAGATVKYELTIGNPAEYLQARTDAEGRFRLTGLTETRDIGLLAIPADSQPHLSTFVTVPKGRGPATAELDLTRGVWVKGRLLDHATGKPTSGFVQYFALLENPHLRDAPGFSRAVNAGSTPVSGDGSFRIAALPGKGILAAQGWGQGASSYLRGAGADRIKAPLEGGAYQTVPFYLLPTNYHALAEIDPTPGAEEVAYELLLETGRTREGTVLGPDGQPLAGAYAEGLGEAGIGGSLPTAKFTVTGLAPGKSRGVLVRHEEKRLIGNVEASADGEGPLTVTLRPWGAFTGRLVDEHGEPRSGVELTGWYGPKGTPGGPVSKKVLVGKDGRFRIEPLLPGSKYYIAILDRGFQLAGYAIKGEEVEPGQTKDLGDVKSVPLE